jgi:hypothetical protein
MTAALLAVHALAERRLLEGADMLGASLTHRFRRAVSFDFNRAAKAASDIAH